MVANLTYNKQEARIAWTILASLSGQDLDIAAMPGGTRQYWSWLNLDSKVLPNSRATRRDPHGSRLRTIKRYSSRRLWQHRPRHWRSWSSTAVPLAPRTWNLRLQVGAGVPPKGTDWPSAAILR